MAGQHFPGKGGIPVDERIVAPESRAEIIEGKLHFAPPAEEKHAVPHADLAYVLRAHVRPGFNVAVDMLTRSGLENDFAPDASVYEAERDADTGGRQLEQLAFEVVNEQPLSTQTTKARQLAGRGVRRIFVLTVKSMKMLEWSRETDAWAATPLDVIDDPVFVRPLRVAALLSGLAADGEVLRALKAKGHPVFDELSAAAERAGLARGMGQGLEKGREEGLEKGREEGLQRGREEALEAGLENGIRVAIEDLCESLGIPLTDTRRRQLVTSHRRELEDLRAALKRDRRWP